MDNTIIIEYMITIILDLKKQIKYLNKCINEIKIETQQVIYDEIEGANFDEYIFHEDDFKDSFEDGFNTFILNVKDRINKNNKIANN
jgi:hypothetical protein